MFTNNIVSFGAFSEASAHAPFDNLKVQNRMDKRRILISKILEVCGKLTKYGDGGIICNQRGMEVLRVYVPPVEQHPSNMHTVTQEMPADVH